MEPAFAHSAAAPAPAPTGAELRAAPRFTLMLRCAKLIADGREYLCVLRDASATGVKVKLFHTLPAASRLELEMPDGPRYPLELVWEREGHAGFRFPGEIDVRSLIDERRAARPRRQLRLQVGEQARLMAHGGRAEALVINLSQQGACIETDEFLSLREMVRIEAGFLPAIHAHVCWRRAPRYGLVFEQGFQLDELARCLARHGDEAPPARTAIRRA
jgi:hypothetical protein